MISPYTTQNEYTEMLLEEILEDFLKRGIIPTYNQLMSELKTRIDNTALGDGPLFNPDDVELSKGEESSVAKFGKFTLNTHRDLKVLFNSLLEIYKRINEYYESTVYEMDNLRSDLRMVAGSLEDPTQFQKLSVAYTLGDKFSSLTNVNQAKTTADVDIKQGECTLEKTNYFRHKYYINNKTLKFNVVTSNPITSTGFMTNNDPEALLNDTERSHAYLVRTTSQEQPVTLEIIIKLTDKPTERFVLSKISGDLINSNEGSGMTVEALHSVDNYTYNQIGLQTEVFGSFSFVEDELSTRNVKIRLTKYTSDHVDHENNNVYVYEFDINNISLYLSRYYYTSVLMTKPLYTLDKTQNKRIFDAVTLNVDEDVKRFTSTEFFISVDKDSTDTLTYNKFIQITPGEKYTFGNLHTSRTDGVTIDVPSIKTLRYPKLRLDLEASMFPESLKIWRNVGVPTTNDITYHGEESGWRKDGNYYKCVFEVVDPNGMIVNFGEQGATIDGKYVNGLVHIDHGMHKFKTHEKNWVSVTADHDYRADPLHPYNHKLIIEGHPNIAVYKHGVGFYAAYSMLQVDKFDFDNNLKSDDYEKFYYDEIDDALYIKLHYGEDYECTQVGDIDTKRELFRVEYQYKRFPEDWRNIDTAVLKAVLKTTRDSITPVLRGYNMALTFN